MSIDRFGEFTGGEHTIVVQLQPVVNMTEDQFFDFCQINQELRIERSAKGELVVMSPAGGETGRQESEIVRQLANWAKNDGKGTAFGPSTGYRLPNGAIRAPDASWVSRQRLEALTADERKKFLPLCPEFVIELRSPTDRLQDLQAKMQEYLQNGCRLGLLIVPEFQRVYVYQPSQPVREIEGSAPISCEPVLPGFELFVQEIW